MFLQPRVLLPQSVAQTSRTPPPPPLFRLLLIYECLFNNEALIIPSSL
jgi:hypothetical protein